MPNPYFQFKQFTVYHNLCAMKVGADGVTLGAWAKSNGAKSILDVGTGSGLIALMLAQRNHDAFIDAIDIDKSATEQARINFNNSPWKERLRIYHLSLQYFSGISTKKYDLIVSNPPYFRNSLKSPELKRNIARHTDALSHTELIENTKKLLSENGFLCLILPVEYGKICIEYAETTGFYCSEKVYLLPNPHTEAKRVLLRFGFEETTCKVSDLTIETTQRHQYTPEYAKLAKDFYLKL